MGEAANILIVDDEEVVRRSYASALSGPRCRPQAARDGDEALSAMEREPFDVVLLDLRMPGSGGLEVLAKMKRRWPDREVVVITGYPSVDSAKEAVRLGAFDYLAKPIGPDELVEAARAAYLRKRWALREDEDDTPTQVMDLPPQPRSLS
ncbi:MAG TPA: response regulator [Usitatibacter sp.]|nr:response regulator [Usitatibacter sp.]